MERGDQIVANIVKDLERAWNDADGVAFARPFAEDADFVNIRATWRFSAGPLAGGARSVVFTL
jgi:uncharacterized protein (TIGR02246 family)